MRVEVCHTPHWPGFQFVLRPDSDADRVVLGQAFRLGGAPKDGKFWIHGTTYNQEGQPSSLNFGWLQAKHFKKPKPKKKARKK